MSRLYPLLFLPLLLLLPAGCQNPKAQPDLPDPPNPSLEESGFSYTNLAGQAAAEETQKLLEQAGIPAGDIQQVLEWAADFNSCMADCPGLSLAGDFTAQQGFTVDYGDETARNRHWYKTKGRRYPDILCRATAFALCQDKIAVESPLEQPDFDCWDPQNGWLISDGEIIFGRQAAEGQSPLSPYPLLNWDQQTIARYFTLFHPVPCSRQAGPGEMVQAVQRAWRQRGISFAEKPYSLLTFWRQNGDSLCVAHAALLAETAEGYLLFEKTNPESPYSAGKFSSLSAISQYLVEMMELDLNKYGVPMGPYLILQDTALLAQG